MEANWASFNDDEIAQRFFTTREAVKAYRKNRSWKREKQRYNGGSKKMAHIFEALRLTVASGKEVRMRSWRVGAHYHLTVEVHDPQQGKGSEPHVLTSLKGLPKLLEMATIA